MQTETVIFNKTISVAVIDSGVDTDVQELRNSDMVFLNDCHDCIGHGTAVTTIIHQLIPDAKLGIYRLMRSDEDVSTEELINALKCINSTGNFNVINLSCSVNCGDQIDELYSVCKEITDHGTVIVAAFDNLGAISYPAAFDNVIGVDCNKLCGDGSRYIFVNHSPVNILGTMSMQRLPFGRHSYEYLVGTSFATPYITAKVAKLMKTGVQGFSNILEALKRDAWKQWEIKDNVFQKKEERLSIKKAILFPFNKEMHAVVSYKQLVSFEIEGVYDPLFFKNVNKKVSDVLGYGTCDIIIRPESEIVWSGDFDTVVLGHMGIISAALNRDYLDIILDRCIAYGKNLYSFDPLTGRDEKLQNLKEQGLFAYSPSIDQTDVDRSLMNKLYRLSTPVIGVFGTSSRQGKFSLQLAMREQMQKIGYSVGGLGTEPSSMLFGLDYTYPMGYESNVKVDGQDAILVLNRLMHEIDMKKYDAIIVGSQSQTVPITMGSLNLSPLQVHEFVIGTEPDAIVLCVNAFDEINYIKRTISYLEGYLDCKVVCLSLFPRDRNVSWATRGFASAVLDEHSLMKRRKYYSENIGLPCFIQGNSEELEGLIDRVTDFFSNQET